MECTFPYPLQSNALTCSQPAGEFQINTDTLGDASPTVAALNNGGFVVVWQDDSSPSNIHGQMYDSTGAAVGAEFQINTDTLDDSGPTVAALNNGGFVVVWFDYDGSVAHNIHGRRYDSAGTAAAAGEFQINTDALGDWYPTVAALNDGGFVVVWYDGSAKIQGRRYDSAGTAAAAGEFQINTDALGDWYPTVAALNDGGFVVVWYDGTAKIQGRRYDSAGTPAAAGEFQINTDTLYDYSPTIAALNDGGFVVVWYDGGVGNIHGQKVKNCLLMGYSFIIPMGDK